MQRAGTTGAWTRQELIRCLEGNKLLSVDEIAQHVAQQPPAGGDGDGQLLLRSLQEHGLLTAYQAEAVWQRRTEDLRIGNYDVLGRIGAGGMGTVYKARHRRMKRVVALKVLSRELCKDPTSIQRFQREVETIARMSHPNIVMAFDADEAEVGHFLVMEFVDGRDLASIVQKEGPLSLRDAVACILQAACGLEYAHAQGIIHRDIKPANLLRDSQGVVKVTDLGLARLGSSAERGVPGAAGITQAGGVLGTVDFMPPEQAFDSTTIDHRADVYSLGYTLYFLLGGQPPYAAASLMAVLLKHREAPIPALTAVRKDAPAALEAVYRRMVAKSPADRFQTMRELVQVLEAVPLPATDAPRPVAPGLLQTETAGSDSGRDTSVHEPLSNAAPGPPEVSGQTVDLSPSQSVRENPLRVLLVEPSRAQAGIIRRYLQNMGMGEVPTVASGEDALKSIRQDRPDVVLSSMHLKDMTGVQLCHTMKSEKTASVPGFLLISSEDEHKKAGSLSGEGVVVLHKPFSAEQLALALRAAVRSPAPKVERGTIKVLIAEDSAPSRVHQRNVLLGLGITRITEVADGAQAVAILASAPFDLLITDYNMPLMDGAALVGYLRQNSALASLPIIMVTTETDPAKLNAVRQLGVAAILDKSFQPAAVQEVVDRLFGKSGS